MADRRGGTPTPPTDSEVVNERWDGEDLSGRTFTRVAFVDVDLTEVTAAGATFDACTFRDCDLNATRFTDSGFLNCTFTKSSFFGARLEGCKLVGSMFDRCRFGSFEVVGGSWHLVGLPGADLRRTVFRRVDLREADLTGARLNDATLHHVDLAGAWLHQADLSGADLRGSDLSAVDPLAHQLRKAVVDLAQAVTLVRAMGLKVEEDAPLDA